MNAIRKTIIWGALAAATLGPIAMSAMSPLLAWREPVYILAGFAGVAALAMLLIQPLLMGQYLPGLTGLRARQLHRWVGALLIAAIVIHVIGLWITSPPDVIDALLFVSPTPFSAWGVIAMWAAFGAAALIMFRQRARLRPRTVRRGHVILVSVTVIGTVIHALLIQGTMETVSKAVLCALVFLAMAKIIFDLRKR
ncbi:MAG: ferric reductase [Pseudomonadota bacterium]